MEAGSGPYSDPLRPAEPQPGRCRDQLSGACGQSERRCLCDTQTLDRKTRNRRETRTISVFDAAPAVAKTEWQPHVAAIIQVERCVNSFKPATGLWATSTETALYLSTRPITADLAAKAVRGHWGVENHLHYTRDVTLREDASRIRSNPGIFARLRSFAYTLLRFNQSDTIPQDRYAAALGGLQALATMTSDGEN